MTERAPARDASDTARADRRRVGLALGLVVLVGALARLYRLTDRTFTHPEAWLPRMDVPDWASFPPAYGTLREIVTMVVEIDVHPPGFWAFMWAWTGVTGTELFWIRLPLALAGIAAILLTYRLGAVDDGPWTGVVAAFLLAVGGNPIFYSQIARKYGLLLLFALGSTLLLRRLRERGDAASRLGYPAVTALGLWFAHVFWVFLAGQIAWVVVDGLRRGVFPTALRSQAAAAVTGSPGVFYAWVQWGRVGYMEPSPVPYLLELATFGGLLDRQRALEGAGLELRVALALLTAAGIACLAAGVALRWRGPRRWPVGAGSPPAGRLVLDPALALVPAGAFFVWNWGVVGRGAPQATVFAVAALAIPILLGARRLWPVLAPPVERVLRSPSGPGRLVDDPVAFLQLAVAAGLALPALVGVRLAATRTLLMLAPLAVVVAARPLVRLASSRRRRVALGATLAGLGAIAVVHVETRPPVHDYATLAERMGPHVRRGDLIVLRDAWWSQPMHYHLPRGVRAVRPGDLRSTLEEARRGEVAPPERVWLVAFGDPPWLDQRMAELAGIVESYRRIDAVEAREAAAELYVEVSNARDYRTPVSGPTPSNPSP